MFNEFCVTYMSELPDVDHLRFDFQAFQDREGLMNYLHRGDLLRVPGFCGGHVYQWGTFKDGVSRGWICKASLYASDLRHYLGSDRRAFLSGDRRGFGLFLHVSNHPYDWWDNLIKWLTEDISFRYRELSIAWALYNQNVFAEQHILDDNDGFDCSIPSSHDYEL